MKNIVTRIVEYMIVVIGLGVWNLVGKVEPSFGWFLSQPVANNCLFSFFFIEGR